MKRKEPVINNLIESLLIGQEDNYYQCLFVENPKDTIIIKNTSIDECKFVKIDFNKIKLVNTHFIDCIFEGCDLSNLEFNKVSIHRCHFINCKMIGSSFIDCSIRDVLFQNVQGRYMNIALGNIRNVEFKDTCLDESSMMEVDVKQLEFNHVSLISSEIFKTRLYGIDLKQANIEGIKIDLYSLKGVHVDMYQAIALSGLLGIIVD